jgi:hypothetical protein
MISDCVATGIANHDGPSIETPLKAMREHFEVTWSADSP